MRKYLMLVLIASTSLSVFQLRTGMLTLSTEKLFGTRVGLDNSTQIEQELSSSEDGSVRALLRHVESPGSFVSERIAAVVDILSIGSNSRVSNLHAQRETMGQHRTVRFFVGVTEDDDSEICHNLNISDAQNIAEWCKLSNSDVVPGQPQSIIRNLRQGYADWTTFLRKKENPAGWLCAQKRASDGFHRLITTKYQRGPLPDYVFLVDDDTYMDMTAVTDFLGTYFHPEIPMVMAGCLLRFSNDNITVPWGGWGTMLSRGALRNLMRPITCTTKNARDTFQYNACQRMRANLFNEQEYFREGITIADWIHAYASSQRYAEYKQWTEKSYFCAHSDWIWGFFFNYYNIGDHTGNPTYEGIKEHRINSYQLSEFPAGYKVNLWKKKVMEGQCRYGRGKCEADLSHICHYVDSLQMYTLTRNLKRIYRETEYPTSTWVQSHDWKSLWTKLENESKLEITKSHVERGWRRMQNGGVTPVFAWAFMNHTIAHEHKHFVRDGIQHSSSLEISSNSSLAPLWIIDTRLGGSGLMRHCERFHHLVRESYSVKKSLGLLADWIVVFLYWDDSPQDNFLFCHRAVRIIGSTRVHRFKRSIINGRRWNETTQFVDPGYVVNYGNWRDHSGSPLNHVNYGVRSDVVQGLYRLLRTRRDEIANRGLADDDAIVRGLRRMTDVSHFWPLPEVSDKFEQYLESRLRDAVSTTIAAQFDSSIYKVFVGICGKAGNVGSSEAQDAYLSKLMDSKIVVVSQKDNCEDHYRLMEALASGAMVMTDPMITLPLGLQDGESIVVYRSLQDLVTKATYYLKYSEERLMIAMKGYRIAMRQHRSWHMMQTILSSIYYDGTV